MIGLLPIGISLAALVLSVHIIFRLRRIEKKLPTAKVHNWTVNTASGDSFMGRQSQTMIERRLPSAIKNGKKFD